MNVLCLLPVLPVGCLDVGSVVLATVFGTTSACTSREEKEGEMRMSVASWGIRSGRQADSHQTARRPDDPLAKILLNLCIILCIYV